MRKTYVLRDGQWVEKHTTRQKLHYVQPDYEDYESPIDGRIVHGKKGRRYDLERTGSRPWEGRDQEQKEADRDNYYHDQKEDRRLDESVQYSLAQMHPEKRRKLLYG